MYPVFSVDSFVMPLRRNMSFLLIWECGGKCLAFIRFGAAPVSSNKVMGSPKFTWMHGAELNNLSG